MKPTHPVRRERNLFEIGDQSSPVTRLYGVASARPTTMALQSRTGLPARAPIQIGDRLKYETQKPLVPGERSTEIRMKPITRLSSARTLPEIGRQIHVVTQVWRMRPVVIVVLALLAREPV
jgi:hypothetical protein